MNYYNTFLKNKIFSAGILSITIASQAYASMADNHSSPVQNKIKSVSATLRVNALNPEDSIENYVLVSSKGMSVSQSDDSYEVIKNFKLEKAWLTNSKMKVVHEIDIPYYEQYFPSQIKYFKSPESVSNVLGSQVCADQDGVFKGQRYWRNQVVYEWDCYSEEGYLANTQLYSDRWSMVVRAQVNDGEIVELVDVVDFDDSEYEYLPDPSYKSIGFSEFLTGHISLESYMP